MRCNTLECKFIFFLGFFADAESKLKKAFSSAADTLRESFSFGHTMAKEVQEEFGYEE